MGGQIFLQFHTPEAEFLVKYPYQAVRNFNPAIWAFWLPVAITNHLQTECLITALVHLALPGHRLGEGGGEGYCASIWDKT